MRSDPGLPSVSRPGTLRLKRISRRVRNRDGVEKPVGSAFAGDVFRAVGENDAAVDAVPVPVFGTCELAEMNFAEIFCFGHEGALSLE